MKAHEIIRNMLDLIANIEGTASNNDADTDVHASPLTHAAPSNDINHFKQIADLADDGNHNSIFANSPNEKYADIDSVTTNAGGGVNGPKHPADIRGSTVAMYPGAQDKDIGHNDHIVRISMFKTLGGN